MTAEDAFAFQHVFIFEHHRRRNGKLNRTIHHSA